MNNMKPLSSRVESKDRLAKAFEESKNLGGNLFLAFFDGNSIKKINDTYGHLVGDEVINHIVDSIVKTVRITDRIIRFGGDEFIVVLPDFNPEAVKNFIQRIQNKISNNHELNNKVGKITASVGLVAYDRNKHHNLEDLLYEADVLMYAAKQNPPEYIRCSGESFTPEAATKRKSGYLPYFKRAYFGWIVNVILYENPTFDIRLLNESAREIWRINGNRVINSATPIELINMIKNSYISKLYKLTQLKAGNILNKAEISEIKNLLNRISDIKKSA